MDVLELSDDVHEVNIDYENIKEILRFDTADLRYSDFYQNILLQNKPGILKDVTGVWKCSKWWVKNGTLNVDYFSANYADANVVVSNCGKRLYNVEEKCDMIMRDYLSYWQRFPKEKEGKVDCLYLKDWHFTKDFPNQNMYRVPRYFASDWLNEYYDLKKELNDDFRFVYIGPKGSWSPFHSDVLTSFSWSANVCGRKKWILLPPGVESCFRDNFGHLKYSIDPSDYEGKPQIHELIQQQGEVIFVPSGWHHQVWNLDDAISVNHNWINACNVSKVWYSLKTSLSDVKKEISDLQGSDSWNEDCQKILGASFVFNYYKFYEFLNQIGWARIKTLKDGKLLVVYGNWSFGKNHMIFDLKCILKVLKMLLEDRDFQSLKLNEIEESPFQFYNTLESFLMFEI